VSICLSPLPFPHHTIPYSHPTPIIPSHNPIPYTPQQIIITNSYNPVLPSHPIIPSRIHPNKSSLLTHVSCFRRDSNLSTGEIIPGSAVPDDAQGGADADWQAYILQNFNSVAHPISTAAMMRRELGGACCRLPSFRMNSLPYEFPAYKFRA
jgi:hypothetical protein